MTIVEISVVLLLILLAGFFAMAEFSIVSSRRNRLEQLAAKGNRGARLAIELADQSTRFLAAVQVGTTLCTMLVGTLSGAILAVRLAAWLKEYPAIATYGTPAAIVILVAVTTYLSLILGELVPKQLALKYPERSPCGLRRRSLFSPGGGADHLVARYLQQFRSATDGTPTGVERKVTEEDIHSIVAEGAKLGVIHHVERDMIEGVLDLADSPVRSIMTPRPQLAWIDIDDSRDSIVAR